MSPLRIRYVLDYICERKTKVDLFQSVTAGGRYGQQKYRLKRCGLRRLTYLLEAFDPKGGEAGA